MKSGNNMDIKTKKSLFIIITSITLLGGCADLTHFNDKETLETNDAVFIDAKQRAVFNVTKFKFDDSGVKRVEWSGICAEPAPDAISSLAATLGVDLSVADKGTLGVSQSLSEAVGNIGIRTAAIQALRDMMYRNCEAYALGGISDMGIETLQRRFQSTMVAILAIEQLTGAVKAPSVVLTGTSSAGSSDAILKLTNDAKTTLSALNNATDDEAKAKTLYEEKKKANDDTSQKIADGQTAVDTINAKNPPSTDAADVAALAEHKKLEENLVVQKKEMEDAEKAYKESQEVTKKSKQAYDAIESSRVAAVTGGGKTSTFGKIESITKPEPLSDAAIQTVSSTVLSIVKASMAVDYEKEVCTTLVGQYPNEEAKEKSPLWACTNLLLISPDKAKSDESRNTLLGVMVGDPKAIKAFSQSNLMSSKVSEILLKVAPSKQLSKSLWNTLVDDSNLENSVETSLKTLADYQSVKGMLDYYAVSSSKYSIIDKLHSNLK